MYYNKKVIFIISYLSVLVIITLYYREKVLYEQSIVDSIVTTPSETDISDVEQENFDINQINTLGQTNEQLRDDLDTKITYLNNTGYSTLNESKLRLDSNIYLTLLLTTVTAILIIGVINI